MKYIIMCGGEYKKWEKPRHFVEVKGEPLIKRTIRLLQEAGVEDIAISTNNPAFEELGLPILHHENKYANGEGSGLWKGCRVVASILQRLPWLHRVLGNPFHG